MFDDIPQRLANQAMLFEVVMFPDKFVPAIFFLAAIDQFNRDCLGCVFLEDFTDNILRLRGPFDLGETYHAAELGSSEVSCPAKPYTPLFSITLCSCPPKPCNTAGFDTVTLSTSGPSGSGGYYYDDFTFTPLAAANAIEITSLTGNGSLTWTNVSALSNALFSVEWAANPAGQWRSSWEGLAGVLSTGLTATVEVPMFFRVKASPNPLLPLPVNMQMTYFVSNGVGTISTQKIAILDHTRPMNSTNRFALLEQNNYQPGFMLLRSTDTAVYSYSPASGGEDCEFQLGPVGMTWTNFNYQGSGYDCKATLEAIENITVPAGTFPCYKFHKQTPGVTNSDRYEWISPGIGFIKWVDYWVDYTQNPPITYQLQSVGWRNP